MRDIRKKILDATLEVIAKEKISGTRMHLIAAEAEMTQSNLHYYFPTKNDLLIALLDDIQHWFSANRQRVIDPANHSLAANLEAIFAEKQDVIRNNKKLDYVQFDYWVQGTVNPEVRENFRKTFNIWRRDIAEIVDRAAPPDDAAERRMLPFLMVSLMMGASMQYLIDEDQFELDQYFEVAQKMMLGLIGETENAPRREKLGDDKDDCA